ncbi:DUF4255 domain-containing protein (plasmid) [Streptomyces murinus]|uniref:DUF4255 domain-containing protein n=1 Tax=Streptomyces murinus TaxID=33900 RepID=UPI0023780842|nr:DUF4255 domain-containing protein [Streptomyces murinus]WDO11330.1 DUF4255 domain-containing protein [Streptomyces murinus]
MIDKVDEKLTVLLTGFVTAALPEQDVEVILKAPTKDIVGGGALIVNAYLYDVREELSRRSTGSLRIPPGKTPPEFTHSPPRYLRLSYMITTWANDPLDAHKILSAVYTGLAKEQLLKLEVPTRQAREAADAVGDPAFKATAALEVGRAPMEDRILSELWSTFQSPLAPLLNLTVTVPMVTFDLEDPPKTVAADGVRIETDILDPPNGNNRAHRHTPGTGGAAAEDGRHT